MNPGRRTDRRGFLKAAAVAGIVANSAFAQTPVVNTTGKKIRVGHIGCGNVATHAYVPDMAANPFIELVSTCDLIPSRADAVAKKHKIPNCFYNIDEMLAGPPFDLLVNTTSMPSHFEVNWAALNAGRSVWSEKPMALRVADAKVLLELAQKKGVGFWAAPTVVTSPQFKFMSDTIASGKLGKVCSAHGFYGHAGKLWSRWFFEKGGGSLYDLGVYNVTTFTGLLGPAKSVVGMYGISTPVRTVHPADGPPGDVKVTADDNTMMIIEHDNAVFSHIQTGYTYFSRHDDKDITRTIYTLDFTGTEGMMYLVGYDWGPHGVDLTYKDQTVPKMERMVTDPGVYTWQYGASYTAECMATGKTSLITPEHGLHVLEVMNACLESQETGRRVKIESTFKWPVV
jgi:predicted dehydrogenase